MTGGLSLGPFPCKPGGTQPETQDQAAARTFYDRISHACEPLADADVHEARERSLKLLHAKPGETVLETGFGTGKSIISLAAEVAPAGQVCGVDISEGMRREVEPRLKKSVPAVAVDLRVAAVPLLPWPDASFDAVILSFTLELFPPGDIPRVLAEIRRVPRKDGRLAFAWMATIKPDASESLLERSYRGCTSISLTLWIAGRSMPWRCFRQTVPGPVRTEERLSIWTMPVAVVMAVSG